MYWKLLKRLTVLICIWLVAHIFTLYFDIGYSLNDQTNWLFGAVWATAFFYEYDKASSSALTSNEEVSTSSQ